MTENEKLRELLEQLVQAIYSTINEVLARGTFQPQFQQYFRWRLTEFEYGDTGIMKKSAKGEELLKPYWGIATWDVYKKVSKLSEYDNVFTVISRGYKLEEVQCRHYLESLITRVTSNILAGKAKTPTDSAKYVVSFLKDLNGDSQEYRAEVQLKGLVLQPRSIQLDNNVKLRRPSRKDFEREVPIVFPSRGTFPLQDPTAFLHIQVYATKAGIPLQNEIDRAVALLRLFRVGAVQDIQHSSDTDSIIHIAGGTLTRGRLLGSDKYLISRRDVKPFKKYWSNMKSVKLPSSAHTGEHREPDEISIAYDRYGDSLEGHVIEKRISSAVMGLEAIYLSENQEMIYRLSMRVGKLLGMIGYKQNEVRERMKDAYEVRSGYVHGGILKPKDRQKLERKYGNLNDFSKAIMDYLRASIVALLVRRTSKASLIKKIDESFLESTKEEEIKKLLFVPYEKEAS